LRIKKIYIREYGPISDRVISELGNFTVFYGKNESGKTLTIDALLKLLFGFKFEYFQNIKRIDENPDGYITILYDNDKIEKFNGRKTITKLIDFSTAEFCNVFIIRDSDLNFINEKDFYNNITDHLLGLRINDIKKIIENLRDIGKITPTGKFRNKRDERLLDKIKAAKECLNKIAELRREIETEKYDEFEEILFEKKEELNQIRQEIDNYENARKREIYEKGFRALETFKHSAERIRELDIFNEQDRDLWRESEKKVDELNKEILELQEKIRDNEEKLKTVENEIDSIELNLNKPKKIQERLENEIKPELKNLENMKKKLIEKQEKEKLFTSLIYISIFLLGISLLGGMITSLIIGYILSIIFSILVLCLIFYKLNNINNKAKYEATLENVKNNLLKLGFPSENLGDVYKNLNKINEEYEIINNRLEQSDRKKERLEQKILNDSQQIQKLREKIKENEKKISDLKEKSNVKTLEDYNKNLVFKNECERNYAEQKAILSSLFNIHDDSEINYISLIEQELDNLSQYKDLSKDIVYNEKNLNNLQEQKTNLELELDLLNQTKEKLRESFRNIQEIANNALDSDDYLYCSTSYDLNKIEEKLLAFLKENNERKEIILELINLFNEIENEERKKISRLLSEESNASAYFNEITGGIYKKIILDTESEHIRVIQKDDEILNIEALSGGTYDQLYFAIRLALGRLIMKDKYGFFILDDPFIKSDRKRLETQLNILKKILESGWQILYFTSKNEIIDTLKPDIENGNIKLIEFQPLF